MICRMAVRIIERVGRNTNQHLEAFGEFCIFCMQTVGWLFRGGLRWKNLRLILPQMYEIGVRSIPVIVVTGGFIGMVMAIETYNQFKAIGQEDRMGSVIILSVVKQVGPVLAGAMLAGRIGGSLAAELGAMHVTEQLDALRVMGSDPIRFLVVPRLIASLLLTPILTVYSNIAGIIGGWFIEVKILGVPNGPFWHFAQIGVEIWQINEGIIKSICFGGAIALISCFKGFTCGAGASGVGRACTESFVASIMSIIIINFFFAKVGHDLYLALYGARSVFGG